MNGKTMGLLLGLTLLLIKVMVSLAAEPSSLVILYTSSTNGQLEACG